MALNGEWVWWAWIKNLGNSDYTYSWSVDMPPSNVSARFAITGTLLASTPGYAIAGFLDMRRRLPDNSDETITFDAIDSFANATFSISDANMTHATCALKASEAAAHANCVFNFWN